MYKNNGFYLQFVAGDYWLMVGGEYPVNKMQSYPEYISPVMINETGVYIWDSIVNGMTVENIACNIANDYGISINDAVADITDFIDSLLKKGCLYKGDM